MSIAALSINQTCCALTQWEALCHAILRTARTVHVVVAVESMKGCDNAGYLCHQGFKFPHLLESLPRATFATI